MSAQTQTTSDIISNINDEDVLRKMWQETEDFGKKKEIRSHMYKLREARLREFYNSNEMSSSETKTITKSSSSSSNTTNKQDIKTHHADSLADHSFLSLKSKEIRDSASPTRDVNYNDGVIINNTNNRNEWNINEEITSNDDGKMMTIKRTATSSGNQLIENGGKMDYAMENEQKTRIYHDGDEKNFTKAIGTSTTSVLQQEAIRGDENNHFCTISSSSRTVTNQRRTGETGGEDVFDANVQSKDVVFVPDGNTKILKETKTLPDGSVVTTTKYVTESGGSSKQLEQKSSKTSTSTCSNVESKVISSENYTSNKNDMKTITQDVVQPEISKTTTTVVTTTSASVPIEEKSSVVTQEINVEKRIDEKETRKSPVRKSPTKESTSYVQPDRRQPIKPGKSELDGKLEATEGQYDTTYRSDYTQKKISVDVSATHDAFARSLRSISPSERNLRNNNSNSSLRCNTSPEKMRHPSRYSPERHHRSVSPKKSTSHETIILSPRTSPIRKSPEKHHHVEYIRNVNDVVTDLDAEDTKFSSNKRQNNKILKRTDTYEERCKQILGITSDNKTQEEVRRDSVDKTKRFKKRISQENIENIRKSPEKQTNKKNSITEFPSQIRKSPEKQPFEKYGERKSPEKSLPSSLLEFPAQKRTSPERRPLEKLPERKSPVKVGPTISEFPSQIRKSPEREPLGKYPERKSPEKELPSSEITEFPSQKRPSVSNEQPIKKILKTRTNSSSSSSEDNDNNNNNDDDDGMDTVEANEFSKFTKITQLENRVPVKEPLCTQKFITQLGKDEEQQRMNADNNVLKETNKIVEHKTVKKDLSATKKRKSLTEHKRNNENIHQQIATSATTVRKTDNKLKQTPKKQTVTATITVKTPKTINKTKMSSFVDRLSKPKQVTNVQNVQNGHHNKSCDENQSENESDIERNMKKKKFIRTVSDQQIKIQHKQPIRGHSKPELITTPTVQQEPSKKSNKKLEKKCISTKSIIINNNVKEDLDMNEIIVDLRRSTSSREPTPDRVCPRPLLSTEDDEDAADGGTPPRYPDCIVEPEEFNTGTFTRKKSRKLTEIPIIEGEDTNNFTRIVDITRKITDVDKVEETDESLLSVNKKINKFTQEQLNVEKKNGVAPKVERPELIVSDDLKEDECLLSVSDKVNKFITTAEELITPQLISTVVVPERPKSPKCMNYNQENKVTQFTIKEQETINKKQVPAKVPRPDLTNIDEHLKQDQCLLSVSDKVSKFITTAEKLTNETNKKKNENKLNTECVQIENEEQTFTRKPSPTRRRSKSPEKTTRSPSLKSTESNIKKTKALFEQREENRELSRQRDILNRPSVFDGRKLNNVKRNSITEEENRSFSELKSTRLILDRIKRPQSPERFVSCRPKSPTDKFEKFVARTTEDTIVRKNSLREKSPVHDGDVPGYMKPLDRSLKTKKSSIFKQDITEEEIEDIFELEILEELLEKIVNYEIRRKIRAQIRLVKKLIQENTLKTYILQRQQNQINTESVKTTTTIRRSKSPESPQNKQKSPERKIVKKTSTDSTFTHLKKIQPVKKEVIDDKPEWVKQRNLRKTNDSSTTTTVRTSSSYSSTRKETTKQRTSPVKETKPTDLITSSYGVGPTDENGTPLFGLRALRSQKPSTTDTTTKVQGTIIQSEYYAKNDEEPIGQISVTKYSNDDPNTNNRINSVTTTQKFGYKHTPSLKHLTSNNNINESSKITRRDSVKSISQKFIGNTVESLKSENKQQQSTYPRAGLILRTSSFKDTKLATNHNKSRETTPEEDYSSSVVKTTKTTISSTGSGGETFFSNRNRVSGVKDVINRMKGSDRKDGDSKEDIEARSLLNKFIGSQVLLSGMESGNLTTTTTPQTKTSTQRRTTKITSTVTESGKPSSTTLQFQRPITEKDLETIWEEHILRLLLEQSTNYEERRLIRARLRQVMAEQEACADLVEKASQEQQQHHHQQQRRETSEQIEGKQTSFTTKQISTKCPLTTEVTRVTTTTQISKKPMSPFAKFRQLDKQNSLNTPPSTPNTPSGSGPLFKFTDPALSQSASTIKDRLLQWCRMKTKEYENIQLDNFSTSWADGLAFCALIHHFLPDAFDYHTLTPKNRRHNFTLAFQIADEKADIAPLLDVDDMVATRKPDWKCVFTYVQSIYRRFKDED